MALGRPPLPLGTYGKLTTKQIGPSRYQARANFRDLDGVTRPVIRIADAKGRAERALKIALTERQQRVESFLVHATTPITKLADVWLATGGDPPWSTNTAETYRYVVENQVIPQLGSVRIGELRPARVLAALKVIKVESGPGSAKSARTVLAGMLDYAVAQDAIQANPSRGLRMPGLRSVKPVRALTEAETDDLTDRLRSDDRAVYYDLPDLVEWMLGTGCRIGEACAATLPVLDLEAGTWEINATLVRVKGAKRRKALESKQARTWQENEELAALRTLAPGLHIQPRPKTKAGWRVLVIPSQCVTIATRRASEARLADELGVLFGSPSGKALRDPSNTAGDLREVLDRLGYEWVTSHVFRKTVATRLDEGGLSARTIADVLGHAKPSMTQDVYMGRNVVSAEAARILER